VGIRLTWLFGLGSLKEEDTTRIEPEPKLELKKMARQDQNERSLNEIFYLSHLTSPSCFNMPALGANMNLKLEPHYI